MGIEMNISDIKVFLVNLDRNPERLAFMDEQLGRLGIRYERVSAVDGRLLTTEEKKSQTNQIRAFFALNRMLLDGEIGCALSHLSIYRRMREKGLDCALVLEDDVVLEANFIEVCNEALKFIDVNRPQVVLFSALGEAKDSGAHVEIVKSPKSFWCTDAYLITFPAAKIVLHDNYPVYVYADSWKRWERSYGMELYRIYPEAAHQDRAAYTTIINAASYHPSFFTRYYYKFVGRWLNPIVDRLWR